MNLQNILKILKTVFMFFLKSGKKLARSVTVPKTSKQVEDNQSSSGVPQSQPELQPSQESSSSTLHSSVKFPYQTDEGFKIDTQEWGCALVCIAKISYEEFGFNAATSEEIIQKIEAVKSLAMQAGYIDSELTILDYDKVFLLFGIIAVYTDKHEPVYMMCENKEREMLYMMYGEVGHFVVGTGMSAIAWDPYSEQGSRTAKNGNVINKRIFDIKGWVA